MTSYRVDFMNEFARNRRVHKVCQRSIVVRSACCPEQAAETAKTHFARLEGIRDWRIHAATIEVVPVEDQSGFRYKCACPGPLTKRSLRLLIVINVDALSIDLSLFSKPPEATMDLIIRDAWFASDTVVDVGPGNDRLVFERCRFMGGTVHVDPEVDRQIFTAQSLSPRISTDCHWQPPNVQGAMPKAGISSQQSTAESQACGE
jgi:hypothetical protein